ncbi:MAG: succinate dehydrogenase, cytochrome b556 subunit [Gammaproteobacteria bacterium]
MSPESRPQTPPQEKAPSRVPSSMDARPVVRPLSPHVGIYRWQVSNTLSIIHRATGMLLSISAVVLVAWLFSLAAGQTAYAQFGWVFGSLVGQLLLIGWTFCFFFHLCNGIRHLAWDADYGFDKAVARKSGMVVVVISIVLSILFWVLALTQVTS